VADFHMVKHALGLDSGELLSKSKVSHKLFGSEALERIEWSHAN
jgi:hypothetical protein